VGPKANGAGGWIASANDLYRFMLGLDKNKYIKPSTQTLMKTANGTKRMDSSYHDYAYGLEVYNNDPVKGVSYFGHSGGGAGFSIDAILEPVSHTIVVFCSNTYGNGRAVTSNYLRVALNKPAAEIKIPNAVKLYDLIDDKGIAEFIANEKRYFNQLEITPDEWLFTSVADAMELAGDYKNMVQWTALGATYFPENGFLLLMQGSSHLQLGEKAAAIKCFEAAKAIAVKNNDPGMIEEAERRIKLVQ
jgi:hypothetical protein